MGLNMYDLCCCQFWITSAFFMLINQTVSASDPCFSKQNFGAGFDVELVQAEPPSLNSLNQVVATIKYDGCAEAKFSLQTQRHGTNDGLVAVYLERNPDNALCSAEKAQRFSHAVNLPLPAHVFNASNLLFAFPPGQAFEYYQLSRSQPREESPPAPSEIESGLPLISTAVCDSCTASSSSRVAK
eukprot:gnl/MRDRNA2_/MRDRNA2_100384_c0_seq1.p1 gnl/MRDRNA2_/MRDRNA2_100384_c0~~gnl/MRDRNA2_/MRDRNA2_100384_c0_seq1.p1  ORF type:complete len:185 (+),score=35.75 gnl/MRDRNA2_/MRDRNA2_100384_c0_seq1:60-614(+)